MKQKFLWVILCLFFSINVRAFELDTSVDEEIRKNYNPSALENSLPALPKTSPTQVNKTTQPQTSVPKSLPVQEKTITKIPLKKMQYNPNFDKSTAIRIKKGTKFKVKSSAYLSDSTREGARLSFTTLTPVNQRYLTVQAGTVFNAVVINSHTPQITGNGGLLEIVLESVKYNGQTYYANGKIIKANHKKIFFNNIKGKRSYLKGIANQVNKGDRFYKKTRRASAKLADNPVGMFISPIPVIFGAGVYTVNLVASPIISVGTKGGKISIPAGSEFEIKITEDIYLQ